MKMPCYTRDLCRLISIVALGWAASHLGATDVFDPLNILPPGAAPLLADAFITLTPAFVNGDVAQLEQLLSQRISRRRRREILDAFAAESKTIEYRSYSIDALTILRAVDDQYEVRADISWTYRGKDSSRDFRDSECAYIFYVSSDANGFRFVDSPGLFDSIGLARRSGFLAYRLFAVSALLLIAAFQLWMIFDCFHQRKRSILWRTAVMLPLIGALAWSGYRVSHRARTL